MCSSSLPPSRGPFSISSPHLQPRPTANPPPGPPETKLALSVSPVLCRGTLLRAARLLWDQTTNAYRYQPGQPSNERRILWELVLRAAENRTASCPSQQDSCCCSGWLTILIKWGHHEVAHGSWNVGKLVFIQNLMFKYWKFSLFKYFILQLILAKIKWVWTGFHWRPLSSLLLS